MRPSMYFALSALGATRSAVEQAVEILGGVAALRPWQLGRRLDRLRFLVTGQLGSLGLRRRRQRHGQRRHQRDQRER